MHASITAVGVDRPGVVAAVTSVLFDVGANIEDSRMAILGGHFSMMLMVSLPDGVGVEPLERALAVPAERLDLIVAVRPATGAPTGHAEGDEYVVSVYGADKPGIVAKISAVLAAQRVNIRDLATHIVEGPTFVYVMLLEVTLPVDANPAAIESELVGSARELGVEVSIHPSEPETL
ncbi:MAG: glycine cleavage system protein R [Actinomycetota bacterium]